MGLLSKWVANVVNIIGTEETIFCGNFKICMRVFVISSKIQT